MWECSPAAAAISECGWRRHALAALPQLGVWLQPPPAPPLQPAVSLERRLSAPRAGVGRGSLLELMTIAIGEAVGADATGSVTVEHTLPWFAALAPSGSDETRERRLRMPLLRCGRSWRAADGGAAVQLFADADAAEPLPPPPPPPAPLPPCGCTRASLDVEHRFDVNLPRGGAVAAGRRGAPTLVTSTWVWRLRSEDAATPPPPCTVNAASTPLPRPLSVRFARSLAVASLALIHVDEVPPDVHRGLELPGARVRVRTRGVPPARAYFTRSLLWEPHTPDNAMPYNVMVLAGAATAFVLGGLVNALARRRYE